MVMMVVGVVIVVGVRLWHVEIFPAGRGRGTMYDFAELPSKADGGEAVLGVTRLRFDVTGAPGKNE